MHKTPWVLGTTAVVLLLMFQVIRPDYDLNPTGAETSIEAQLRPSAQVQHMLQTSCYSCHSAQATIPWYGHVWPASQLMQNDVRGGRARLDFSNWSNLSPEMSRIRLMSACNAMRSSEMPLWYYRPMHPGSKPKAGDVEAFCSWAQSLPASQQVASFRQLD